jgi:hypothetical protein
MNALVRCSAVVVLLLLSSACGSSGPTSPTAIPQLTALPSPTPPPTTSFPPLSGPSRTFIFDRESSSQISDYAKKSRFVLYDNGAFVLQYVGLCEYRGRYTEANGIITFEWEGWSAAGPWGATGSISDDSLAVRYNAIMQLSDFEDGVYVRTF